MAADSAIIVTVGTKADTTALDSEAAARAALGTRVGVLEAAPPVDISGKADTSALSAETSARIAADAAIITTVGTKADAAALDSEAAARIAADAASNTYTDTKVAALVNGAPGTLDTLNEIAVHLASGDSTAAALATTVGTKASQAALDSEAATRYSADNILSDRASSLESESMGYATDWTPAQGNTRTITHSLGQNISVQVMESGVQIYVDRVTITSTQIILYSPHTPATTLRVLYKKI